MQGFKALEVKYSEHYVASHILYVKAHNVREKVPEKPVDRTLFVVGVPPYLNEECLKQLFTCFGKVTAAYLEKTPSPQAPPVEKSKYFPECEPVKGYKVAYVVFNKQNSIDKVLKCNKVLILSSNAITTGIEKWFKEYNDQFLNERELELEIKSFMEKFDEETSKKIQKEKDLANQQEDGWITVTKRGRNPGFARKESVTKQLEKRIDKQNKKKQLANFFTFQIKESKMQNLISLRKQFEEDRRKIAALKEARRFKPF